jgi:hypothetical protein
MSQCAICLNEVRETRSNKPIRCGHLFHSNCLEKWKNKGKQTCPVCRKVFDGANFRVHITIHNNFELTSNTVDLQDEFIFDALDIFFDVNNQTDISSLLSDFGVSVSDFDPSILNTE